MKENSIETPNNFYDHITFDKKIPPQEAIQILSAFHKTEDDNILDAFAKLRGFEEGTVEFRRCTISGIHCVVMEGCNKDGKFSWNCYIDRHTGQPKPEMRIG